MRYTYNINQFHGGVSDDIREPSGTTFGISKHFDIFSNPMRLTPYRSFEEDTNDGSSATGMKQYLLKDGLLGSDGKLYGLGIKVAGGLTKIFYKSSPESGNWTLPGTAEGNGVRIAGSFTEYKGSLWGFQGTNQVWRWVMGGAMTDTVTGVVGATITSVSNSVIAADDCLYMGYNNVIIRVDNTYAMEDGVLTLPSNLKITSICNYGLYLAIGCAEKNSTSTGTSMVYIWDLVQDDPQEALNWGEGSLLVLDNIEGKLIGVSDKYIGSNLSTNQGSIVVRAWRGGDVQIIKEINSVAATTNALKQFKVVKNNKLYFYAKVPTSSSTYNEGIWVVGRRGVNYEFATTIDQTHETATSFDGVWSAGNYWFIAHDADGSIAKTNDAATYANTSIYESQKFNAGDSSFEKKIQGVAISFLPLKSGQRVVGKYRVDALNETTSWTTFSSDSTVGHMFHEATQAEPTEREFSDGKEIQIRIESVGGAEITGLKLQVDTLQSQINE